MASSLDLNLIPLGRQAGKDQPEIVGLHVADVPRRAARGRKDDRLILYLSLIGNAPLSPGKQEQILARLGKTYYDTSGSVTYALRTVAEALNHFLLDRNVRNASTGQQSIGLLTLVALRGDQVYLAQSGPVHAFVMTAGQVQQYHDIQIAGRGLGLSRTTPIRYNQVNLQPNDTLLLSTEPAPTWTTTTLAGLHGQGPETLRRRLVNQSVLNLNAVLIQARPGTGKVTTLHPSAGAPGPDPSAQVAVSEQMVPESDPTLEERADQEEQTTAAFDAPAVEPVSDRSLEEPSPAPAIVPDQEPAADQSEQQAPQAAEISQKIALEAPIPALHEAAMPAEPGILPNDQSLYVDVSVTTNGPAQDVSAPTREKRRPKLSLAPVGKGLVAVGRPFLLAFVALNRATRKLLARMLPGKMFSADGLLAIPSTVMALVAIAVPVVVVSVAFFVYSQLGNAAQYELFYKQAEQKAVEAVSQSDLSARRQGWQETLTYLDQAERYQRTAESQQLRAQIRIALDELELIRRPDYQPAIVGGLPDTVRVKRILLVENDLYLLDRTSGSVLRALFTSRGYQLDQSFQCGPGVGGYAGGLLIDIVPAPPVGDRQASVMGLDANGNLLFCSAGQSAMPAALTPPPSMQMSDLVAMTMDLTDLYVLDPKANAVWVYWGGDVSEQPVFFFGEQVPPLKDVIDLTVNNEELYLLHADGHITLCYYSGLGVAPTRCSDPTYIDYRPGRENRPFTPDNAFSQVLFAPPPDPSLYLLDAQRKAIHRFSLRNLAFQHQYLPAKELLAGPATAFAVNQVERTFYLAVGNWVYYANIP